MTVRLEHWWLVHHHPGTPLPRRVCLEMMPGAYRIWEGTVAVLTLQMRIGWSIPRPAPCPAWKARPGDLVLKAIRNRQMLELSRSGETYLAIARRFDLSCTRVSQLVRREREHEAAASPS